MIRRPIASALLLWYLAACTSWRVQEGVTPKQLIANRHPSAVRVSLADSSQFILKQPRITVGDSLAGLHKGAPSSVAVSDVTTVAIRRFDAAKSVGLYFLISLVLYVAACGSSSGNDYVC